MYTKKGKGAERGFEKRDVISKMECTGRRAMITIDALTDGEKRLQTRQRRASPCADLE